MKENNLIACILLVIFLGISIKVPSQNLNSDKINRHSCTFLLGHTQVSQGINSEGKRTWLSLPSWSINYNYLLNAMWAIGLHSYNIIEEFAVKEHLKSSSTAELERSYPVSSVIVSTYKPGKHFGFLFGLGGEFAHTGNLLVARVGLDYGIHITKTLEFTASVTNDIKFAAYNAWNIGVGITKKL